MKKLQPVLDLINLILLQNLQVRLQSTSEEAVGVTAELQSILLKTDEAEGLTIENVRAAVEKLQLPGPGDLNLYVTLRLDSLDLLIAPVFWARAARLARNALVANFGLLLDRVEVRDARVEIALSPARIADIVVTLGSSRIKLLGQLVQETVNLRVEIEDLDLAAKDKKKALAVSTIRLGNATIRVMEVMLNRLIEIGRDKIPAKAKLSNLDIALVDDVMRITMKTGYLPMSIPIELQMSTQDNQLGIYIVKIFVGMARGLILSGVKSVAAGRPELRVGDDNIWINPWAKIPFPVQARFEQFAVNGGAVVIQFADIPARAQLAPEPSPSADESVAVVAAESGRALPPPLP
jgi:hypothetical protein